VAIALVLVVGGGAFGYLVVETREDPEPVFCTLEGYLPRPGPPGYGGPELMAEDRGNNGPDNCDEPTDGSAPYAVIRGEDCTIAYPDGTPEEARTHTTVEPFGVDGTCWYAIDED
jgi:hypothetical protein